MLLAPPPPAELPAEALFARLRARRAALDLQGTGVTPPRPAATLAWLWPRLENSLRIGLTPYLEIEAMLCLRLALRYRLSDEVVPAGLLRQPWLAKELGILLGRPGDARTVLTQLEVWLTPDYPFAARLTNGYLAQGPGQVERQLIAGILMHSLARARVPVVRMTIRFLTDLRNLLAVLRHWRWQLRTPPALLPGGELETALLARVWADTDKAMLERLAARLSGKPLIDLEPRAAERELLSGLTRRLRQTGRDPLGLGLVIDYVWRCQMATRNHLLQQSAAGEDGLLAAALL